jgi:hypothetical protein
MRMYGTMRIDKVRVLGHYLLILHQRGMDKKTGWNVPTRRPTMKSPVSHFQRLVIA